MTTFTVVTKIEDGNLATALGQLFVRTREPSEATDWVPEYGPAPASLQLSLFVPVWRLGEIVVLGPDDRTIPDGRKPSKWFIETEDFDTIEEAITRSLEVTQ